MTYTKNVLVCKTQWKHEVEPQTKALKRSSRLQVVKLVEKACFVSSTRVQLFLGLSWIHIFCGVTIIDLWIQCCVCQSGCCQNVLGTRTGKRKADGTIRLGGLRPAGRCLVQGVCISWSRSNHKSLPQYLIVLCHPQCVCCVQFGLVVVMMSCLTGFLLHNVRFLPDKPHQTWHPSLTWNRPPAEMHHSVSQPCQGRVVFYPSGNRSGFLVCVTSNQHTSSEGQSCHYKWAVTDET